MTTAERRQQQNVGIPESKALLNFVVHKGEFKKTVGYNRWSSHRLSYSFDEACFNPVAISRKKTPSVFLIVGFFLMVPCSYKCRK